MSEELNAHILHEVKTNGVMNTVFNGGIAFLLLKGGENLTLRGDIIVDLMATGAILLFIVSLILIPLNRSKVAKGKLTAHNWDTNKLLHRWLQRFPKSLFARALIFALVGLLVIAPLTAGALFVVGATEFSPLAYSIFKGLWAGLMAAMMTVPMVLVGTANTEDQQTLDPV
ncbi:MAG: hypothetical protein ACR2P1_05525 [Pseudomonadales bacterium]